VNSYDLPGSFHLPQLGSSFTSFQLLPSHAFSMKETYNRSSSYLGNLNNNCSSTASHSLSLKKKPPVRSMCCPKEQWPIRPRFSLENMTFHAWDWLRRFNLKPLAPILHADGYDGLKAGSTPSNRISHWLLSFPMVAMPTALFDQTSPAWSRIYPRGEVFALLLWKRHDESAEAD
jgi:hypothetical protein